MSRPEPKSLIELVDRGRITMAEYLAHVAAIKKYRRRKPWELTR